MTRSLGGNAGAFAMVPCLPGRHRPDQEDDMSRVWFTADTHFGHARIIDICRRPFGSVDEMDRAMVANWNAVVGKNDQVFHLGDFAYRADQRLMRRVFSQLNGQKFLIEG